MYAAAAIACVLAIAVAPIGAHKGFDISEHYSDKALKCMKDNGYSLMIVRSFFSYGAVDPNGRTMLANAHAVGLDAAAYHFPCRNKSPSVQIRDDIEHLKPELKKGEVLYLDIETNPSPGCGWSHDLDSNCKFIRAMIKQGKSMGVTMGVYVSEYMWSSIAGSGCHAGEEEGARLWYPNYDRVKNFDDFTPFGGWKKPFAKQYWDGVGICGVNADANIYH
jgi:GH25 family lysozyme M1 (1,4-beta-N-acetylmuramidase)